MKKPVSDVRANGGQLLRLVAFVYGIQEKADEKEGVQ